MVRSLVLDKLWARLWSTYCFTHYTSYLYCFVIWTERRQWALPKIRDTRFIEGDWGASQTRHWLKLRFVVYFAPRHESLFCFANACFVKLRQGAIKPSSSLAMRPGVSTYIYKFPTANAFLYLDQKNVHHCINPRVGSTMASGLSSGPRAKRRILASSSVHSSGPQP